MTPSKPIEAEGAARKPFLELKDLPKLKLADGTEVKLGTGKFKKSRLGKRFNGKHND